MKKFALIWLLMLTLLPTGALAQGAEWLTYAHPDAGYSIDYPSDWTAMDRDSIDRIWDDVTAGKIKGLDPATLESNEELVRNGGVALFVAPGGAVNYNVMYQDIGATLTADELIEAACPSAIEGLREMFPKMEVLIGGSRWVAGDVQYAQVLIRAEAGGEQVMIDQAYTMKGSMLYILTFTVFPDRGIDLEEAGAIMDRIGASFK